MRKKSSQPSRALNFPGPARKTIEVAGSREFADGIEKYPLYISDTIARAACPCVDIIQRFPFARCKAAAAAAASARAFIANREQCRLSREKIPLDLASGYGGGIAFCVPVFDVDARGMIRRPR